MICGGREEREPVSPLRTLQNYHIDAENDKEMALLETKLRYCLEENMIGYGENTIGGQKELRDLERVYCIDHCLAGSTAVTKRNPH